MATNVFDENFRARLLAFQRDHGLALDGKLGTEVWTQLTEQAATPKAGSVASPEPTTGTTGSDGGQPEMLARLAPENFPLLAKIANTCQDEAGVRRFLLEEVGLDLDELARDVESVMAEEATV
ncbi:peptidoglycan-binding domain-containing protein [Actinophytocola glycyrrhizae]|uniref:Peptidoglycan-binding domain-containing protein n=1 Tax=Actinophytocola glycyrrhizae TaxID=2044873 RepID=A0ABV9S5F9_9PSEU